MFLPAWEISCYSTGSQGPNLCCPLAIIVEYAEYVDHAHTSLHAQVCAPKVHFPMGELNPHQKDGSLGLLASTPQMDLILSAIFVGLMLDRHTDHRTLATIGNILILLHVIQTSKDNNTAMITTSYLVSPNWRLSCRTRAQSPSAVLPYFHQYDPLALQLQGTATTSYTHTHTFNSPIFRYYPGKLVPER